MSKDTDQNSGVVGGTMDVSRDTNIDSRDSSVLDAAMARRHEAARRARNAERLRREREGK